MQILVEIYDSNQTTSKDTTMLEIEVLNNVPSFLNFSINQKTDGEFNYIGNTELIFGFWGSDPENKLKSAKISIISEAGGEYMAYNYTFDMSSAQANFSIFTKDFPFGEYTVYGYLIDAEGFEIIFSSAYIVVIREDSFESWTPWLMLIFGIIAGLIIGSFIVSTKAKKEESRVVRDSKLNKSSSIDQKSLSPAQKKKMREMRKIGKSPKSDRVDDEELENVLAENEEQQENNEAIVEEQKSIKNEGAKPQTKFKKRV
jgi:hypothetical protein